MDLVRAQRYAGRLANRGLGIAAIAAAVYEQFNLGRQAADDIAVVARRAVARYRSGNTVTRLQRNIDPFTHPIQEVREGPRKSSVMKRPVPNVIPGGIGHYQGDFKKRRTSVSETALTKYGSISEQEMYGEINSPDVQYFGVQSANYRMVIRAFVSALIRMVMWRHFKITYSVDSDLMFEAAGTPEVTQFSLYCRQKNVNGVFSKGHVDFPITNGTRFGGFVDAVVNLITQDGRFGFTTYYGWHLCGYQFIRSGSSTPVYYIDQQRLRLNVFTVIQLQNVTRSNYTEGNFKGYRDDIGANPLVGRVFTLKGLWPKVEDQMYNDVDWGKNLQVAAGLDARAGIILPSIAPEGHWRSIPNPQVFANIMKCESGLRLEPGDIKKDVLKFSFYGTVDDFRRGFLDINTTPPADNVSDAFNTFGVVKLFAFEKVVPTGRDSVEMNYHLDRYVSCVFDMSFQQNSVSTNYAKYNIDGLLVPPEPEPEGMRFQTVTARVDNPINEEVLAKNAQAQRGSLLEEGEEPLEE